LLRSREIDGLKLARSVKAANCILQRTTGIGNGLAGAPRLLEADALRRTGGEILQFSAYNPAIAARLLRDGGKA
jgi:hypothetical protein